MGHCNDKMCSSKIELDIDNFLKVNYGLQVMVHEYGHILDFLITKILDKQNEHFHSRKYIISSLANDTKITNKSYQKLLAYGIIKSSYGRTSNSDLFTEGFGRWLLTPEQNRDLGWKKLDKFFRVDLLEKL